MNVRRSDEERIPPMLERISDYVSWYAERQPEAQAMALDGRYTSYAELQQRIDAVARALVAAGVP